MTRPLATEKENRYRKLFSNQPSDPPEEEKTEFRASDLKQSTCEGKENLLMVDNCTNEFSSFDTFKCPKDEKQSSLDSDVPE